ncbi:MULTISPECIES: hypothetical protein [unclassified Sphingomonas]|uniref:hypothetical protein n=1 Tax=unclassified Sphingomonas TaxID=196159 RepID=UPI0006F7C23F|nr:MULTISPECIES: hypothetical protein [unclassified Sphingomonas]KQS48970.1 hypothetical protein ASG20_07745 [Sphingomonas sp. Leaf198]
MLRGLDEELAAHKYSHVERERRFLVDPLRRPSLDGCRSILIEDLYITDTRCRLRRMTDSVGGRVVLKLSKKYDVADPLARPLVTTYLTPEEYALFAALPGHWLRKRRHAVPSASGEFGIDLFEGALAGLELAEIEQPDAASLAAAQPPEWARSEVTYDLDFQGGTLALLNRSRAETFVRQAMR